MKNFSLILLTAFFVFAISIYGCGTKAPYGVVPIEGMASWDGQPLSPEFTLQFNPADGKIHSTGIVTTNGQFRAVHTPEIDGVPIGQCTVTVSWSRGIGEKPPEEIEPLLKKYGPNTPGLPIEITKKDLNMKVDFPR
ncbi:MAG: hypothetical protein LBK06_04790 [Planctomycetaceae bacterium]|jgi:hypothetical protein|nr:hypothetical protein [Planctomycetaceae bacterium]